MQQNVDSILKGFNLYPLKWWKAEKMSRKIYKSIQFNGNCNAAVMTCACASGCVVPVTCECDWKSVYGGGGIAYGGGRCRAR